METMQDAIPTDNGRGPSPAELAAAEFAIRPELNAALIAVINSIADIADRDCYGSDNDNEGEPCECDRCSAKRAIAQLNQIRLPVVRSLRPDRLNYAERVYFDAWVKQNTRCPGINRGLGTLELLLRTEPDTDYLYPQPAFVSQRDMDVATTVVQWLGTNCGRCFVETCEREWRKRQEERRDVDHVAHVAEVWSEYREKPLFHRIANGIAERFGKTDQSRAALSSEIAKAMFYAKSKANVEAFESEKAK